MASTVGPQRSLCSAYFSKSNEFCRHGGRDNACMASRFRFSCHKVNNFRKGRGAEKFYPENCEAIDTNGAAFSLIHVQTLRNYPRAKLSGEVVAVRLDSSLFLKNLPLKDRFSSKALHTIKYLYDAGALVLLLSSWDSSSSSGLSVDYFADHLSSLLQLRVRHKSGFYDIMQLKTEEQRDWDILLFENLAKFKEDIANGRDFSKTLSIGVGVFVNDAFSLAHKIHASTVGISRFCYSSVAGFHFEEELNKLASIAETTQRPYVAIIGGKNFIQMRTVLHILTTKCDALLFIGNLSFQIMHALGMSVPMTLVEDDVVDEAVDLIHLVKKRSAHIIIPDDFLCINDKNPEVIDVFPRDKIQPGWTPVDLGPVSWQNISCQLLSCKKVLMIGPMTFKPQEGVEAESTLSNMLKRISQRGCDVAVVGNASCMSSLPNERFQNSSVVWEFLKGRTLPGVAALDRTFPFDIDWKSTFDDPNLPLAVDVGSANATSTFRAILSSYPGEIVLVSIQCPNPDFNKPENRWKMVTRLLVEAVSDLLALNGKVYLQSDIEEVARRIKDDFMVHGNGVLVAERDGDSEWIRENPFGVRSDWERHVLARGKPMFRVLLTKVAMT